MEINLIMQVKIEKRDGYNDRTSDGTDYIK